MVGGLLPNLHVPYAIHATTDEPVTVHQALLSDPPLRRVRELGDEERVELVISAWRHGMWDGDILVDAEEPIDIDAAETEVRAGTELGKDLLAVGVSAIEMLEDMVRAARAGDST